MILYELAKQMEEHERLRRTIGAAEGDIHHLIREKRELRETMLHYFNLDTSLNTPAANEATESAIGRK